MVYKGHLVSIIQTSKSSSTEGWATVAKANLPTKPNMQLQLKELLKAPMTKFDIGQGLNIHLVKCNECMNRKRSLSNDGLRCLFSL